MPDNGLANLAGALVGAGHRTVVLDYNTVGIIERLCPEKISRKTAEIYTSMAAKRKDPRADTSEELEKFRAIENELEEIQERVCHEIALEIAAIAKLRHVDFIGFKLWNGDGFTGSVKIASEIKRLDPKIKIFAGGPHVDYFLERILRIAGVFDALAYGDGEEVILDLAKLVEKGSTNYSGIPNLIYKDGGQIRVNPVKWVDDLNRLPLPLYDEQVYPAMAGDQKIKILVLDESRGCPNNCHFCIQPAKTGRKLRLKSPQRVFEEISRNVKLYNIRAFRYAGSTTPTKLASEVAALIISSGLDVDYTSFGSINFSRPQDFEIMKQSGCHAIFFGVESGSKKILAKAFDKKQTPQNIKQILKASKDAGIFTIASIIYPAPFETEQTRKETLGLLYEIKPQAGPVQPPFIAPRTKWMDCPNLYGYDFKKEELINSLITFKAKLLLPPELWGELSFTLNKRSFKKLLEESAQFTQEAEKHGMLTRFSDEQALMAKFAEYEGREREFRDYLTRIFSVGDRTGIGELVTKINSNSTIKERIATIENNAHKSISI